MNEKRHNEDGQGLVEYALILIAVALIVIVIVSVYGAQVGNMFSRVTSSVPG
jgi:pilus assembly protein Flp/PilA